MDITAFGLATKAAKELKDIKKDMGQNVEGAYNNVKERLDQVESDIEKAYLLANKAIVNNAINITKAEGRLNAITMAQENNYTMIHFDELYNLYGIDTTKSKYITHDATSGIIESYDDSCEVVTNEINIGSTKNLIVVTGDQQNRPFVRFKGKGGFIFGNRSQYSITGTITLEAVFKMQEYSNSFGNVFANVQQRGWSINFKNCCPGLYLHINRAYVILQSSTSFNLGELVHVVGTYDGTTVRLYVNGVLEDSQVRVGTITTPNENLVFGYNPPNTTSEAKDFDLYEARVFNRFRTIEEIEENKKELINKEGLVLHVKPVIGGMKDLSPYGVTPEKTSNFTGQVGGSSTTPNLYKGDVYISFDALTWHKKKTEEVIDIEKVNSTGMVSIKIPISSKAILSYYSVIWE